MCVAGKYSIILGASDASVCSICDAGKWSPRGSNECINCIEGKYLDDPKLDIYKHDAESDCKLCISGKSSLTSGATSEGACKICGVGKW